MNIKVWEGGREGGRGERSFPLRVLEDNFPVQVHLGGGRTEGGREGGRDEKMGRMK